MTPHAASSARFSHVVPEGAQRRHPPSQAAVQHTLEPLEVGWQRPAPQSASKAQLSPAPLRQPSRSTLQPSTPHSIRVRHWPPLQRWKLEPEHWGVPSSQTGAGTHPPVVLHTSLSAHAAAQHTLPLPAVATQAPVLHSELWLHAESSAFFARLQLP